MGSVAPTGVNEGALCWSPRSVSGMGFFRVYHGAHWWVVDVRCSSLRVATAELKPSRAQRGLEPVFRAQRAPAGCGTTRSPGCTRRPARQQSRTERAPQALPCLTRSSAVSPGCRRPDPASTKAQAPRHCKGSNRHHTELGADPRRGTQGQGEPRGVGGLTTHSPREPAAYRLKQDWPTLWRAQHAASPFSCPWVAVQLRPCSPAPRMLRPPPGRFGGNLRVQPLAAGGEGG